MLRHSRAHHRLTHHRHQARRFRLVQQISLPWYDHWRIQDVDTHCPKLLGKKSKFDRHREERSFRQAVRNAMAHADPLPRYCHDWAD